MSLRYRDETPYCRKMKESQDDSNPTGDNSNVVIRDAAAPSEIQTGQTIQVPGKYNFHSWSSLRSAQIHGNVPILA